MLVFGGAILLSTAGATESTDLITWDNSCGDNRWLTCCDAGDGEDHYMDNNWALGTWPDYCLDFPGPADCGGFRYPDRRRIGVRPPRGEKSNSNRSVMSVPTCWIN